MINPDSSIVRELDESQRALLAAIRNIDQFLKRAPNGDGPLLVKLKLSCLTALDALGRAARIASEGGETTGSGNGQRLE